MICKYALDSSGNLVFIDDVKNGLECNCKCPSCDEKMIAKNNGKIKDHHFAHESGHTCERYRETLLHIWSKEIIENEKAIRIPDNTKLTFKEIYIERVVKEFQLKPDIIGILQDDTEIWIEIAKSHECDESKKNKIIENNIKCLEIKVPEDIETNKDILKEFLLDSNSSRYFIEQTELNINGLSSPIETILEEYSVPIIQNINKQDNKVIVEKHVISKPPTNLNSRKIKKQIPIPLDYDFLKSHGLNDEDIENIESWRKL